LVFPEDKAAGAWRRPIPPFQRQGKRKNRAVTLLPIWEFVACSRATFNCTFTLTH